MCDEGYFNPSTLRDRDKWISDLRIARDTQRNYASKNKNLKECAKIYFKDQIIYSVFFMLDW